MLGRRVYESTNTVGVNFKIKIEPRKGFEHTPAALLPPGARQVVKDDQTKAIQTRSELGTCVGMSTIWCRNLFQAVNEAATKPSDMPSHFVQSRWEHFREKNVSAAERLREFKEFLETSDLSGGNITLPARTNLRGNGVWGDLITDEGTFLIFCPGHCVALHRVEFQRFQGLRARCWLYDPDKGLFAYQTPGDLDLDLESEYTRNRRYTANPNVDWYYLKMG